MEFWTVRLWDKEGEEAGEVARCLGDGESDARSGTFVVKILAFTKTGKDIRPRPSHKLLL
jgi:hypothetical protein